MSLDAVLAQEQVLQFAFAVQWTNLRAAAAQRKIRILGDVAIFVNMDSADVWMHPDIFELDEDLRPIHIAGVPPDYFSPTGQRWGNPLYRWDVLEERGFDWWIDRIRRSRELYDLVRLDHFRGFESYWSIPADEETAINGEWVKAPGLELFRALEAALGPLPTGGGGPGTDYAGGGCAAAGACDARNACAAVWIWRQGCAHAFAASVCTRNGGLYRHARQRHDTWMVGDPRQDRTRGCGGADWSGAQSANVAVDSSGCGKRGRDRDCAGAGFSGTWIRGADEYTGRARWKLELARSGRKLEASTGGPGGGDRGCDRSG